MEKIIDKTTGVVANPAGFRDDCYEDKGLDFSNPIKKTYIHKDVVKITGDTEDDFIIEQKPVLVDEVNVQKQIDEAAKGADIKSLVAKALQTGDESILNQREVSYGDASQIPTSPIEAHNLARDVEKIRASLPDDLKNIDDATLMQVSKEDIAKIVEAEIAKRFPDKVQKTVTTDNAVNETAGKETV